MKSATSPLTNRLIHSSLLFLLTLLQASWPGTVAGMQRPEPAPVQLSAKLSQSKFVQHGTDTVFLDVTIKVPGIASARYSQQATDMIIVLDRSGSMSETKKMPYAKAAIWDVLARLNGNDRFALVSFANNAIVQSPLITVNSANREYLNNIVSSIIPSGGTNMGEGLQAALRLLQNNPGENARKILLLSDGMANQGITHPQSLAQIAAQVTQYGAVVSTIGMGLGFNETLMSMIADVGMGHYAYLEDLSGLGAILTRDLSDTRHIFANSSTLEISHGDGVQLIDAGGYPMVRKGSATVSITTGQLLANSGKHLVMTLKIPTANITMLPLGALHLNYRVQGEQHQAPINPDGLMISVVAPEFRQQTIQSIDRDVYQQSWLENNLGRMKKKLSQWVREGKKDLAEKAMKQYRADIKAAEAESNVPLASPALDDRLETMKSEVDEAFIGTVQEQQEKRNRAAKSLQYDAIKKQRSYARQ